jgi:hypothetical protein
MNAIAFQVSISDEDFGTKDGPGRQNVIPSPPRPVQNLFLEAEAAVGVSIVFK